MFRFCASHPTRWERPGCPQCAHSFSLLGARQAEKVGVEKGGAQRRLVQKTSSTFCSLAHQVTSLTGQGTGSVPEEQVFCRVPHKSDLLEALSWEFKGATGQP